LRDEKRSHAEQGRIDVNMIIGFGSTETAFENAEEAAFKEYVAQRYAELNEQYISDELAKDVEAWFRERADAYKAKADEYKTSATFPDRYSYIWPRVIHSASDIFVRITFHHVNRRHAMSPGGWALMATKRLFDVEAYDLERALTATTPSDKGNG
jgi:hypothetical protein